jgi:hypothetical protein
LTDGYQKVFLTRKDLEVFHEPFGEPFYHSKERLSIRYEEEARKTDQYDDATYKAVFDDIIKANSEVGLLPT